MENPSIPEQNCAYCDGLFTPKRRWIQKYCCESCRTLACRERKNGISGTLESKPRSFGMNDLKNIIDTIQAVNSAYYNHFQKTTDETHLMVKELWKKYPDEDHRRLINKIDSKNRDMESKLKDITHSVQEIKTENKIQFRAVQDKLNDQDLNTFFSSIFAHLLSQMITKLVKGENPNQETLNDLFNMMAELKDEVGSKSTKQESRIPPNPKEKIKN